MRCIRVKEGWNRRNWHQLRSTQSEPEHASSPWIASPCRLLGPALAGNPKLEAKRRGERSGGCRVASDKAAWQLTRG